MSGPSAERRRVLRRRKRGLITCPAVRRDGFFSALAACPEIRSRAASTTGEARALEVALLAAQIRHARFLRRSGIDFPRLP